MAQSDILEARTGYTAVTDKDKTPALVGLLWIFLSSQGSPPPAILTRAFLPRSTANGLSHSENRKDFPAENSPTSTLPFKPL